MSSVVIGHDEFTICSVVNVAFWNLEVDSRKWIKFDELFKVIALFVFHWVHVMPADSDQFHVVVLW